MRNIYVASLAFILFGINVGTAQAQPTILPNGVPTINLGIGGAAVDQPMTVAFDPVFNQYYGGIGGFTTRPAYVWNAAGVLLQTQQPANVDVRAYNYNPNTNALECITFNAINGGSPAGLVVMGLNGSGLLTGSNTNVLGTMTGLSDSQTSPAYDPMLNRLYSRGTTNVINVVNRANGSLITQTTLNLAPAGNPSLQGEWVGFDSFFDVFVTLDITNDRALVHDLSGNFLGSSQLTGFHPVGGNTNWNVGYTNGQIFTWDSTINAYRGFQIFTTGVPEPSTFLLIGTAVGIGAAWQVRRLRKRKPSMFAR
jgi:hypothetical protein